MDDAKTLGRSLPEVDADVDLADARAAAQDPTAFDAIYRRHRLAVYRYARSRTSSEDDALDLTSVTFERALRAIGSFRPRGGGMAAWLLRIARNASIDDARRSATRAATRGAGDAVVAGGVDHTDLRLLVAALPERQREAIDLRYAGGLTAREIGWVLSISEDAAQKHLERALQALREAYGDD